jgi:uncharacterized membrane protein (DUF4010 family)
VSFAEIVISLVVAVAAGGLIGAERQQAHRAKSGEDFGGIRTFPLVALAGACGGLLRPAVGPWGFLALFGGVASLLAISHARSGRHDLGISSEVAALVTFALGTIATTPELLSAGPRYLVVGAVAGMTMALLALKRPLHGFVARISEDDVYATVKFVLLALVFIPVLPNHAYGPYGAINPFKVGVFTALVAAISFAGYVAVRWLGGQRGAIVTGLFGGLASSTAVTLTFAARTKEQKEMLGIAAIAIVAASATMFARMLVILGIRDRELLVMLALPLGAMALTGWAGSFFLYRRETSRKGSDVSLKNPFELKRALQFGVLYVIVSVVAKGAQAYAGKLGLYASAVVAGIADVDAITLSMTELHLSGTEAREAGTSIVLAAVTNTIVKAVMAAVVGGWPLGKKVGIVLVTSVAVGAVLLAVT